MKATDQIRFPSGTTIAQIKKDAKQYAKQNQLKQSEALDFMAEKHGIKAPWNKAISTAVDLSYRSDIELSLPYFDIEQDRMLTQDILIKRNKPLWIISGFAGTGKTVLANYLEHLVSPRYQTIYKIEIANYRDLLNLCPRNSSRCVFSGIYGETFKDTLDSFLQQNHESISQIEGDSLIYRPYEGQSDPVKLVTIKEDTLTFDLLAVKAYKNILFRDSNEYNCFLRKEHPIKVKIDKSTEKRFSFDCDYYATTLTPNGNRTIFPVGSKSYTNYPYDRSDENAFLWLIEKLNNPENYSLYIIDEADLALRNRSISTTDYLDYCVHARSKKFNLLLIPMTPYIGDYPSRNKLPYYSTMVKELIGFMAISTLELPRQMAQVIEEFPAMLPDSYASMNFSELGRQLMIRKEITQASTGEACKSFLLPHHGNQLLDALLPEVLKKTIE